MDIRDTVAWVSGSQMGIPQPFLGKNVVGIQVGFVRVSCVIFEGPPYEVPLFLVREQVWDVDETRMGFEHVCGLGEPVTEVYVDGFVGENERVALPAPVQDLVRPIRVQEGKVQNIGEIWGWKSSFEPLLGRSEGRPACANLFQTPVANRFFVEFFRFFVSFSLGVGWGGHPGRG